jgi:hypothetical protein
MFQAVSEREQAHRDTGLLPVREAMECGRSKLCHSKSTKHGPEARVTMKLLKRLGDYAFIPPSTVRFAPVMYDDSGPATNATIAAISSARP